MRHECNFFGIDKSFSSIAVLGAGLSLDYSTAEIKNLVKENSFFVLSDRIAKPFISLFPKSKRAIVSVESRHHDYLKFLKNEKIFFYRFANAANLPSLCEPIPFDIKDPQKISQIYTHRVLSTKDTIDNALLLPSPGTVGGMSLAVGIFLVLNIFNLKERFPFYLFGLDFCYPSDFATSRFGVRHHKNNRFYSLEKNQYEGVLQRFVGAFRLGEHWVRTSEEFYKARENSTMLVENTQKNNPGRFQFIDYSIPGIESFAVQRKTPLSLL